MVYGIQALVLIATILGAGDRAVAQDTVKPKALPGRAPITNAQVFWGLDNSEKSKPQSVRFDVVVYYYDPLWQLIWGEIEGRGSFLPVRGEPLPIKTGQRVVIEGVVVPSRGILRDEVTVTVLQENALPEPLSSDGRVGEALAFDAQWTSLRGYVCQQREVDATHLEYQVMAEGWLVTVRMLVSATEPLRQLVGEMVRFNGVYVGTIDADQHVKEINFWVPRSSDVTVLGGLNDDPRFQLPVTPLEELPAGKAGKWVRILGALKDWVPGQSLVIRDDTGQIAVKSPQPASLAIGDMIEVVGRLDRSELNTTLEEPLFRILPRRADALPPGQRAGAPTLRLRVVQQIMELPPSEASRGYPVSLRGTVSWSNPKADFFFLHDATGNIRVRRFGDAAMPPINQVVAVEGVSSFGQFAPEVQLQSVALQALIVPPAAPRISLEQALSGEEEARQVEMYGYIRDINQDSEWTRLDLTADTGEFSVYVPMDPTLTDLLGASVGVTGVCTAETNQQGQMTGIRLWAAGRDALVVDQSQPADPFSIESRSIASLTDRAFMKTTSRRVRVLGRALLQVPGRYLYLQDESGGLLVLTRETKPLAPGTWIDVVGFPGRAGSRMALREAVWRAHTEEAQIVPQVIARPAVLTLEADSRLVRVSALLRQVVGNGDETRLTLQADNRIVDAIIHSAGAWTPPEPGSLLELTGVYVCEFDEYRRPHSFHLELPDPSGIALLASPSWWTAQRALFVAGVFAFCAALILGWVVALRRRVQAQTEMIRLQLEKEARLQNELERSSRLESLGVLAGGIAHDFNNLLTAILGNLGLAAMDKRAMAAAGDCIAEAERGARRARDITQQLLTFAKGGDPVRTSVLLPDIVTEAANFARHGTNVRFDFDFPPDLPPGDVDAGQISRVVHNLVLNAVQAMPDGGVVSIGLAAVTLGTGEVDMLAPGRYIRLTVADTGKGIPPEILARIFDPYFSTKTKNSGLGLATVRSIIKKHNGHVDVQSRPGTGTTFAIWLPVAREAAVVPAGPSRLQSNSPARILLMDDEEVIRKVAGRMLSLANHEVVFAVDGGEAIRLFAEARKAASPFDLVIFDLTVPGGMGGKDALQELLKIDPDVRAIASSGYSSDPVMANPQDFGFRATLAKPYDIPDLMRVVEQVRAG
jgi:two-component system, cell cycle sensor histidine kinase and response regulator CckA